MEDSTQSILLENGNTVHFKKHPRYGTWSVSFDKGGIPDSLSGQYLLLRELKDKVKHYLEHRPARNRTTYKDTKDG